MQCMAEESKDAWGTEFGMRGEWPLGYQELLLGGFGSNKCSLQVLSGSVELDQGSQIFIPSACTIFIMF